MSCDVLITSVPYTQTRVAPAAPAILIGMLERHGFSGKFYDFNRLTFGDDAIKTFALGVNPGDPQSIDSSFRHHVNKMLEYNPKYIGISLFSYQCIRTTQLLCIYLRTMAPEVKIILGGPGLSHNGLHGVNMGAEWQELKLCDHWVKSEGEHPIIDILEGDYVSTPEWTQIKNLDEFPIPVYDSYDWSLYRGGIPITGSRGCVRKCTFCDIHTHWKKFVWRSGKSIADEMIAQSTKHGIYDFAFTDSLVNGSMKAYKDMCVSLADYNNNCKPEHRVSWSGLFIFRPANQMPADVWRLSAEAGIDQVYIGIESLDESVRDHMRKKFSNEDIIYGVKAMQKYGIKGTFLMIVGYVTDTEETIKNQKDMFEVLQPYAGSAIWKVQVGSTLAILPGTPLAEMAEELGITLGSDENDWVGLSDNKKRLEWRQELIDHCVGLGFDVPEHIGHDQLMTSGSVLNA